MVLGASLTAWANWRERKGHTPGQTPLVPYPVWQFIGIIVFILMTAHLITLLTGQPFTGRRGF
jgi:hypothetical protein